ncbi:uncharacterized protein LOC107270280 [Cephus cinctus]|uniref:Uncharacterized protein LOC107270280 n=1 Tax=Cephus cinctus TaxID=211228 RepID=A0AAJ7C3K9_CEPCN|nr:uncharacterized protein LOC107270280 [Cephus cinctus]
MGNTSINNAILNKMLCSTLFVLLFSSVLIGSLTRADSPLVINVETLEITNKPNDYMGDWSGMIHKNDPENTISLKMIIKSTVPDNMMVKLTVNIGGTDMPESTTTLCGTMSDKVIVAGILEVGKPEDTFPKECPIEEGVYEVIEYHIKKDNIPSTLPDGKLVGHIEIYMPGEGPIVKIDFQGDISHKMPSMG